MNLATEAVALSGQRDAFLLELVSVDMLHDFPVRGRLQLCTDLFGLSHLTAVATTRPRFGAIAYQPEIKVASAADRGGAGRRQPDRPAGQ